VPGQQPPREGDDDGDGEHRHDRRRGAPVVTLLVPGGVVEGVVRVVGTVRTVRISHGSSSADLHFGCRLVDADNLVRYRAGRGPGSGAAPTWRRGGVRDTGGSDEGNCSGARAF